MERQGIVRHKILEMDTDMGDVVAINDRKLSASDFQEKAAQRGGSVARVSFAVVIAAVAIEVIVQLVFLARGLRLLGAGTWPPTVFRQDCVDVIRDHGVAHSVAYSQIRSTLLTPNLYVLTFTDGTWLAVRRDGFTQGMLADVRARIEQQPAGV